MDGILYALAKVAALWYILEVLCGIVKFVQVYYVHTLQRAILAQCCWSCTSITTAIFHVFFDITEDDFKVRTYVYFSTIDFYMNPYY